MDENRVQTKEGLVSRTNYGYVSRGEEREKKILNQVQNDKIQLSLLVNSFSRLIASMQFTGLLKLAPSLKGLWEDFFIVPIKPQVVQEGVTTQ